MLLLDSPDVAFTEASVGAGIATVLMLSALALTKLDGTAKGGIVVGISKQLGIPIKYIGIGEKIDDLRPFNASDFVGAIFE